MSSREGGEQWGVCVCVLGLNRKWVCHNSSCDCIIHSLVSSSSLFSPPTFLSPLSFSLSLYSYSWAVGVSGDTYLHSCLPGLRLWQRKSWLMGGERSLLSCTYFGRPTCSHTKYLPMFMYVHVPMRVHLFHRGARISDVKMTYSHMSQAKQNDTNVWSWYKDQSASGNFWWVFN